MCSSLFLAVLVVSLSSPSWAFPAINSSNVPQCGVAKSHADNGYTASYSWAAALFMNGSCICTGTIIGPRHILTAAHCLHNLTSVKVGATDFMAADAREYSVKSAVGHPGWDGKYNDLAVLTLEEPIVFNERVAPICMDSMDVQLGEIATVAGWGTVSSADCYGKGSRTRDTTILHQGHMHVVGKEECRIGSFELSESQICTKGVNAVAGAGDSGGMLMVEREGRWYQVGVTSGFLTDLFECVLIPPPPPQKLPEVFTSVAYYQDWIQQEMNKE